MGNVRTVDNHHTHQDFFFSSRRRHTRCGRDWSSDVCSSDLGIGVDQPTAEGFVNGGAWGWDEMVPTVEATGSLPDHGEAWRVPWEVVTSDESECVMRAEGHAVSWRLERRLQLGDVVRASYSLSNAGATEIPGYWCAHPLFRYEAGMEIDIGSRLMGFAEGKSGKRSEER